MRPTALVCCTVFLSSGGWLAGCAKQTEFGCSEDSDCVRGGEPGLCQPTRHCSYEDQSCASGFRYPTGAPAEFSGICAGEGRETEANPTSSTGASSTGPDESSTGLPTSAESSSSPSTPGETTTATTSSEGSTTDVCESLDQEPNDDRDSAQLLEPSCELMFEGNVGGLDPIDYFRIALVDCSAELLQVSPSEAVSTLCVELPCDSGVEFCSGRGSLEDGFSSCCAEGTSLEVSLSCNDGPAADVAWVSVASAGTCEEYVAEIKIF